MARDTNGNDEEGRDNSDNVSVRSMDTTASDDSYVEMMVTGQEGVEGHVQGEDGEMLPDMLIAEATDRMERRPSFLERYDVLDSPAYIHPPSPDRIDNSMIDSMINEPGSGVSSMGESMTVSVQYGRTSPANLLMGMGAMFDNGGLFVVAPLRLGIEQEFCQNMQIGGCRKD